MAEKSEAEWSVAADPVGSIFGGFGNLADRVGAQIGELLGFDAAPYPLCVNM